MPTPHNAAREGQITAKVLVLIVPALVRMENQFGSVQYLLKSLVQRGNCYAQHRTI